MTFKNTSRWFGILGVLLVGLGFLIKPVSAQEKGKERQVKIIALRFAAATDIVRGLERLYQAKPDAAADDAAIETSQFRIAADYRTNSVILSCEADVMMVVSKLIESLDTPQSKFGVVLNKMNLAELPESFLQTASRMFEVEVAVDPETGIYLLKGDKADVDHVQELMNSFREMQIDSRNDESNSLIRLIWLVSASHLGKEGTELSPELKPVATKLESMGVKNLGVACQIVARLDAAIFRAEGMAVVGDSLLSLQVASRPHSTNPKARSFEISGRQANQPNLFQFSIGADLVPEKTVVLSSAPIFLGNSHGPIQSVFVVQLVKGD